MILATFITNMYMDSETKSKYNSNKVSAYLIQYTVKLRLTEIYSAQTTLVKVEHVSSER